jgi:hypothetical protein
MKNHKHKKNMRKILIISGICVVTVLIIFAILEYLNVAHFLKKSVKQTTTTEIAAQAIDYNPPTNEQKKSGEDIKTTNQDNTAAQNSNLSVSITTKNITDSLVQIRSAINGIISNNGDCTITLSKGDQVITKTAKTYALPSDSTCQGFDIDRKELSIGSWDINLSVSINQLTANITDKLILE